MADAEWIQREFTSSHHLPVDAIREVAANREEMGPILVDIVERHTRAPESIDPRTSPIFLAFHMLGQLRWQPAYRPLARFLRIDPIFLQDFIGDATTETCARVMAAVFDGDPTPIHSVIEDEDAAEYVRCGMFELLGALARSGDLPRGAVALYLRDSYTRLRHRPDNFVWYGWQNAIAMLGLRDLRRLVERIFSRGIIDPTICSYEDFLEDLALGENNGDGPLGEWAGLTPFGDTVEELSGWQAFKEREEEWERRDAIPYWPSAAHIGQPARNPHRHVGRNDPCPCGSARKFKRCCLQ